MEMLNMLYGTDTDLSSGLDDLMEIETETAENLSVSDSLVMSLAKFGKVDIDFIADTAHISRDEAIAGLTGQIYQNPINWCGNRYLGWETAEEYLSGDLRSKLKSAEEISKVFPGVFDRNIQKLKDIIPPYIKAKDIYVSPGSPWLPIDVVQDFVKSLLGLGPWINVDIEHDEMTGSWEITNKYQFKRNFNAKHTYGTPYINGMDIIEKTLNMRSATATDEVVDLSKKSGKRRVVNRTQTILALEKQKQVTEKFLNWVWKDKRRTERLEKIYNSRYTGYRPRRFNGDHLEFPGMNSSISLYPYQKNAAARIIYSPNTLLAHDVGSGKTYIMAAAGMKLRQMGLSKKNMYVVPNNIIGQWHLLFKEIYPNADILCVYPSDFTPTKREKMLERMRDEEHDAIIIAYSSFKMVPISNKSRIAAMKGECDDAERLLNAPGRYTGELKNKIKKLRKAIAELALKTEEEGIYFDDLHVTRLFVDEAHNFKNLPVETQIDRVLGISKGGSARCKDMLEKVRLIQRENNGGGVIFSTGTPITNSVTDAYVMQYYLQQGALELIDLQSFDAWIAMFAEKVTEFEIDVDTSAYRLATRFSKFHNLPELTAMLSAIADFHSMSESDDIPTLNGRKDTVVPKSSVLADYLTEISHRADMVRGGRVDRTVDNMLKITTDGRKAALDMRLLRPEIVFLDGSTKVWACAKNAAEIYFKYAPQRSAQVVFCDISTPKQGFNIYDELRAVLVKFGVNNDEIEYIHSADTDAKREKLFAKVRSGKIRILIGSTAKLGLGVNIQDRLIALHHIDVPWRPADMTQREGRILRQGNQNDEVFIYRYITEGSFDAYSWQLLETKQAFIDALLSGSITQRDGAEIENTVLDYAEVKALAIGDPLIKERVEVSNELRRLTALQRMAAENRAELAREFSEMPSRISAAEEAVKKFKADRDYLLLQQNELDTEQRRELGALLVSTAMESLGFDKEQYVTEYRGFRLVMPINFSADRLMVSVRHNGSYAVHIGTSEIGAIVRLDNFFKNFDEIGKKVYEKFDSLKERRKRIRAELYKKVDYSEKIAECEQKLADIDKELGV